MQAAPPTFHVDAFIEATERDALEPLIHRYLQSGPRANWGLSDGLKFAPRFWIGPLWAPLDRLERCCGPEPDMAFRVPLENWRLKVSQIAAKRQDERAIPPLIVEWCAAKLIIRDGNHRHAAMQKVRWQRCWIIFWCNSVADYHAAKKKRLSCATTKLKEKRLRRLKSCLASPTDRGSPKEVRFPSGLSALRQWFRARPRV